MLLMSHRHFHRCWCCRFPFSWRWRGWKDVFIYAAYFKTKNHVDVENQSTTAWLTGWVQKVVVKFNFYESFTVLFNFLHPRWRNGAEACLGLKSEKWWKHFRASNKQHKDTRWHHNLSDWPPASWHRLSHLSPVYYQCLCCFAFSPQSQIKFNYLGALKLLPLSAAEKIIKDLRNIFIPNLNLIPSHFSHRYHESKTTDTNYVSIGMNWREKRFLNWHSWFSSWFHCVTLEMSEGE